MAYISKADYITAYGFTWRVNSYPSGLYTDMLKRLIEQPLALLSYHSKILGVRLDLHIYAYDSDNKRMSVFTRRFNRWVKRRYGVKRVAYSWVREHESSEHPHFHYVVYVDGHKVRYPAKIVERAKYLWELMDGFCYVPEHCYYYVLRGDLDGIQALIWRVSYLAKGRGKGNRPPQTKDYACSRLKFNESRSYR